MDDSAIDRGAQRRAAVRSVVGRPGSLRRWILISLVILIPSALLFARADFLGKIAVFIVAAALILSSFRARSLAIGDEDELRAALRRQSNGWRGPTEIVDEKIYIDDEEWEKVQEALRAREYGFGEPPAAGLDDDDPLESGTVPCEGDSGGL